MSRSKHLFAVIGALTLTAGASSAMAQQAPFSVQAAVGAGAGVVAPEPGSRIPLPFQIEAFWLSIATPKGGFENNTGSMTYGNLVYPECQVTEALDCTLTLDCGEAVFVIEPGIADTEDLGAINGQPVLSGSILTKCLSIPQG